MTAGVRVDEKDASREVTMRVRISALKLNLLNVCAVWSCSTILAGFGPAGGAEMDRLPKGSHSTTRDPAIYRTQLFGKTYRLDERDGLAAYIRALDAAMQRADDEQALREAHKSDPLHNKLPPNFVDKKMRRAMKETRKVATQAQEAVATERPALLKQLYVMAGAIRASFMRVLPPDMDAFDAFTRENALRRPPVGLGNGGPATNLAKSTGDLSTCDPLLPSTYWTKPADISTRDLYYGFDRRVLPSLDGQVCTYRRSKQGYGTHGGFEVSCERYGKVTLKFGKEHSQPFAQRIFWALGYNTVPHDYVRTAKVKWDPRIFTEFNTRRDQTLTVSLLGAVSLHTEHLQHYVDPFEHLSEVLMLDDSGAEVTVRPSPTWDDFKRRLFKNARGRPETIPDNFNMAFANRIRYLIFRDVNIDVDSDGDDDGDAKEVFLGNWDWGGEGNQGLRETRGATFLSAWLNQFDPRVCNNKLYLVKRHKERSLKHSISDVGVCLGRADNVTLMLEQLPNDFPWTFTRPAQPGARSIPLDGSYHTIQECAAFRVADIDDTRWIARYIAQLTGKQILDALVASGMPSAQVRLYYNKLVTRRNKALKDLGLDYPAIPPMDAEASFDYDPQRDGLISIVTSRNEKVTAPDDGWVVVKGSCYTRAQLLARTAANPTSKTKKRIFAGDWVPETDSWQ